MRVEPAHCTRKGVRLTSSGGAHKLSLGNTILPHFRCPHHHFRLQPVMSEPELALLIQSAHDIVAARSYQAATGTILFYDHFLTIADEVKYAWCGRRSWGFWLFLVNRYFPITFQLWVIWMAFFPDSSNMCDETAWYPAFTHFGCTLLAQVVLTMKIYAMTMKNVPVTTGFAIISGVQLVLGIYLTVLVSQGAEPSQPMYSEGPRLCLFVRHRAIEIAYTSISLLYDSLAFSLTVFLVARSDPRGLGLPTLWKTIGEDATRYFLVIFTSHVVLWITLIFGRGSIQLLPAPGTAVYIPVMTSRIILSLRKAADLQRDDLSLGVPSTGSAPFQTLKFCSPRRDLTATDSNDISLDTRAMIR